MRRPSLKLIASAPPELSREELLEELRARNLDLLASEAERILIAAALWPDDDAERPPGFELADDGLSASAIVAGIKSLHEYAGRLVDENYALRGRLEGVATVEGGEHG